MKNQNTKIFPFTLDPRLAGASIKGGGGAIAPPPDFGRIEGATGHITTCLLVLGSYGLIVKDIIKTLFSCFL